ncbi:MAG: tRNA lysidine(34) synthetase TilS [Candidatus Cryptobacteroides sp.]
MLDRFEKVYEGLVPDGKSALFAVSGGIDSMCMAELAYRCGKEFAVAHCNFHLRGEESDGDEAFVRQWAESRGVVCHCRDFDTDGYASSHSVSIEMAARELRYEWFNELCEANGYCALAVAHNANDNVETMLLNLLRGTGLSGITGMKEINAIPVFGGGSAILVRPMLGFTRREISDFVSKEGIAYREDHTNNETVYKRNKLRHNVLPVFEEINPSFLKTITSEMRDFAEEHEIADDYFYLNATEVLMEKQPGEILRIDTEALMSVRHWKYILYRLVGSYGFRGRLLEQVSRLLASGDTVSGRRFESGEYVLATEPGRIVVRKSAGKIPHVSIQESECCSIVRTAGTYLFDSIELVVEIAKAGDDPVPAARELALHGLLAVDSEAVAMPFVVRGWRKGDWMRPMGMRGAGKKLSDIFTDMKLGISDKASAMVIVVPGMTGRDNEKAGEHVAAVCGHASGSFFCRVDESVKVTASTGSILTLRVTSPTVR